jgi:hypothetical protein
MKQPGNLMMWLISLVSGTLIAVAFMWIFGIEISDIDRFRDFPDGWSLMELAFNAFAIVLLVGATRAVYKGLQEYYNPSDNDGPPIGGAY